MKRIVGTLCLVFSYVLNFSQSTTDSSNTSKPRSNFYVRRDFCEAVSFAYDWRVDKKHSYEFNLGVKSPWGVLSLPWMLLDLGVWNEMNGIRLASIYKVYPHENKFYLGPAVDLAFSHYKNGGYHACTHCQGATIDINFTRLDAGFFFVLGRKGGSSDLNFGIGFRTFYCDMTAHYGPPQYWPSTIQNGDYAYMIGKAFFGAQPGYVKGFYLLPGIRASIALGK